MIKGHGNDIYAFKDKIKTDFSSNVWFEGPHEKLVGFMAEQMQVVGHYPEPDAASLAGNLEKHFGLTAGTCLVTNGSAEAFYIIAQALGGKSATIFIPSFSEYEDACARFGYRLSFIENKNIDPGFKFETQLAWLGNPNNPDGKVVPTETLGTWLKNNPETIFIVDEAYGELCANFQTSVPLLGKYPNLIVVKSFTKTFAIPGIRLGFLLCHPTLQKRVAGFRIPWSVNALAVEAGNFILAHYNEIMPDIQPQLAKSVQLQQQLGAIEGLEPQSSTCNFFLVKLQKGKASQLKEYLIDHHGILIRDASNFRGLNPAWFRVSLQSENENQNLLNALSEWSQP